MSSLLALALLFAIPPQVHPGPGGTLEEGPYLRAAVDAQMGRLSDAQLSEWMRVNLGTHAQTRFRSRFVSRPQGGGVLLVREYYRGLPVAGSQLAIRLDANWRVREVVGKSMRPGVALGMVSALGAEIWWPTQGGLVAAQLRDDSIELVHGHPEQFRRAFGVVNGEELAAWSILDEADLPILGWRENPVITPQGEVFTVEVSDAAEPVLQNDFIRVVECNWDEDEEACVPEFGAVGDPISGWMTALPELDDDADHEDLYDPWAGPNTMQLAMRFLARLEGWGWSPQVWDVIDCEWQEVEPSECQLWLRNNVRDQDEEGVFPFAGAYYSTASGIYMGQGIHADTSFDGDVVIHEIGHHVTRGFGNPEPTEIVLDRSRRLVDRSSINEGTSDFFARQMSSNDRIYDYYIALEPGPYIGVRTRDVDIAFRCPENLTGEVHMDGRIWVSALRDAQVQLADVGLVTEDEFMTTFLVALASVRMIPTQDLEQFPEAIEILIDEFNIAHGGQVGAIVRSVFDDRGLRNCQRTLDVRENPHNSGLGDLEEPLDARFMVLSSWGENTDDDKVFNSPPAPPLHHRVTLGQGETSIRLDYQPRLWRPARVDTPTPPFVGTMLVKAGDTEIAFWHNEDTGYRENDADFRVDSEPQDEDGWAHVEVTGLAEGATYHLAFASLTKIAGDRFHIAEMSWEIGGSGGEDEGMAEDESESEGDGDGELGTDEDGDTGLGGGRANGAGMVGVGCACSSPGDSAGWAGLFLLVGLRFRRRR